MLALRSLDHQMDLHRRLDRRQPCADAQKRDILPDSQVFAGIELESRTGGPTLTSATAPTGRDAEYGRQLSKLPGW
ncbi:MAG: hypothetical protein NVSMB25_10670 [Thermoleophilaceae bacterium]